MTFLLTLALLAASFFPSAESDFVSLINSTRTANGLPAVTTSASLNSYAAWHSSEMLSADAIYHSSADELWGAGSSEAIAMGENVGRGNTPASLHEAFMNSPTHRANILGDWDRVGVGTMQGKDRLYVTVIFEKVQQGTPTTVVETEPTLTTGESTTTTEVTTTTTPPTTTNSYVQTPVAPPRVEDFVALGLCLPGRFTP